MPYRTIATVLAVLLLAACVVRGPNVASARPTATAAPVALPAATELSTWVLSTTEIDYANYTAYTLRVYLDVQRSRINDYVAAVDAYRADPTLLTNNAWRAKVAAAAAGLTEMSYFFKREAPSPRFVPILAQVEKIAELLRGIDHYATIALDGDSAAFDDADKLVAELKKEVSGVEAVFATLLGG